MFHSGSLFVIMEVAIRQRFLKLEGQGMVEAGKREVSNNVDKLISDFNSLFAY